MCKYITTSTICSEKIMIMMAHKCDNSGTRNERKKETTKIPFYF